MNMETELRSCPPASLRTARAHSHLAVQLLTKAARANIESVPDDSHASITWSADPGAFRTETMNGKDGAYAIGFTFAPMTLCVLRDDQNTATLGLGGISVDEAEAWLDGQLEGAGLSKASPIALPYKLPAEVAAVDVLDPGDASDALAALATWFDLAHSSLAKFAAANQSIAPGPSPVVCWPHHFDIATYVSLEDGNFETARAVGVGMSPGDESYDQPYFYINPWPHLATDDLPTLPAPGHWHTEGFVGAVVTADELLSVSEIERTLQAFVDGAFTLGRARLGF